MTGGHIRIKGYIHNKMGVGYGHELTFENEVDQTYLGCFAKHCLPITVNMLSDQMVLRAEA